MGKIVKHNQPCLACNSSDAMQVYEDGAKCFSCGKLFTKEQVASSQVPKPVPRYVPSAVAPRFTAEQISKLPIHGFQSRDITRQVCEFYEVRCMRTESGEITHHFYPYDKGAVYKIRICDPKSFQWLGGHTSSLFGMEKFEKGGRRLIIVEGETDALAMQQANLDYNGKFYPAVAVPSASDLKCLVEHREWIRSFKEVVICFDNDTQGQEGLKKALRIIGYDKCRVMDITEKDVNDQLIKHGGKSLVAAMFNAQERSPAGVVSSDIIREAIKRRATTPHHPYSACLSTLNSKIKGKRGGEIVLFVSGTGCGKSTMFREEILNVLNTTKDKVGIVSLEESVGETGQKLAAMNMNKNPSEDLDTEELLSSFDKLFVKDENGEDRILVLDHQGAITDNTIMDQLEYMCLKGCKYLFIDHITIMVSEGVEGLTGNEAQDKVMNDLLRLVKRYPDVWIGLISHLRKAPLGGKSFESGKMPSIDDIRGSGSIKQISFDIIAFSRDTLADDVATRNHVDFAVLKCRWNGNTGPAGGAYYDHETGRMRSDREFKQVAEVKGSADF